MTTTAAAPAELFERYRAGVDAALRAAFDGLDSPLSTMARYQLGWVDADGNPVQANRGKALRPTLCLLTCEALGGDIEAALPAAAGVELLHNFSLVHDDVMDNDLLRRHRPTVWAVWGQPKAIDAGDFMHVLATLSVLRAGEADDARAVRDAVEVLTPGLPADDRGPVSGHGLRGRGRGHGRRLSPHDRPQDRRPDGHVDGAGGRVRRQRPRRPRRGARRRRGAGRRLSDPRRHFGHLGRPGRHRQVRGERHPETQEDLAHRARNDGRRPGRPSTAANRPSPTRTRRPTRRRSWRCSSGPARTPTPSR